MRAALACVALLVAAPASAWGPDGHVAVAAIAERALSPAARAEAEALLGGARLSDVAVASWADEDARAGRSPRAFHYVNVPVGAKGYDPARDCRGGRCLVAKLEQELAVLGDPAAPRPRRAEALRWVVHLVADAHQPLHCADRGDRGGNDTRVLRRGPDTNLHALWDGLPDRCEREARGPARRAPPMGAGVGHPRAWVEECHAEGVAAYAAALRHETGRGVRLPKDFAPAQCAVVERQLARAGARLAKVVERALGPR